MAAQADVPGLLSRLSAASLLSSGVPEDEVRQRQVYLLKMMAGILGSNAYQRNGLEGGGDDMALLHSFQRKELEAAGADKAKIDKFNELCNRLSPGGGRPGLAPRLRTSLLVLLRQLHRAGRDQQLSGGGATGRIAPTFSLTPAVSRGGLPATYVPAPLGLQQLQQLQQQQSALLQPQQSQRAAAYPPRPASVASYAGSASGAGVLRPTSVITPSEMGDDPALMLSTEASRTSLMGTHGGGSGGGGGGGDSDILFRGASLAAMPGGGLAGDPPMAGAGAYMPATTEAFLVRDVLYAAQGVRGRLVEWFPGPPGGGAARDLMSGFRPNTATAAGLAPGTAMLLDRLTELGWLFRRVREHISACTGAGQASVRQALGAALVAEMGDYYRLLAVLEAQAIGGQIPTQGDTADASNGGGGGVLGGGGGSGGGQYLTLIRLQCWLSEPLRRMRLLAGVGDAAEGLEGGALAGAVYEYSRHGDPFVAANAAKLLQQVCVPLYGIIRRWVLEGELDDHYNEFFVVQHAAAAAVNAAFAAAASGGTAAGAAVLGVPPTLDLWRQSYGLDESRLPPFIGPSLAQRILRAGKAIHYLNLACGDRGWVQQRAEAWAREPPAAAAAASAAAATAAAASATGELAALEGLVSAAVRSVDERLLTVIWRHHRLRAHFAAIRRFLLLGQGDWVTAFMDLAQRELDKPASDVSEVQLNSCLRQALTATNVLGGGGSGGALAHRGMQATAAGLGTFGGPFAAGEAAAAAAAGAGGGGGAGEYDADEDVAAMGLLAERLRVKKERAAGAGETGWDVFSLYYNPAAGLPAAAVTAAGAGLGAGIGATATPIGATSGGPLSALFTPAVLLSYNRLARLLWQLKRAEHALSAAWKAAACGLQRMVDKMGADGFLVQPVLAMLLRLRFEMSHFATNLQYYIQFEVMEASWQEFYSRATSCDDLDSLIDAHEAHLATLLRKAFLAHEGPSLGPGAGAGPGAAGGPGGGRGGGGSNNSSAEGTPGGAAAAEAGGGVGGPSLAALRRALQDALSNMVTLRSVAARLEELVAGGARLLATRAQQAKARMARGGWGSSSCGGGGAAAGAAAGGSGGGGLPGLGSVEPPIPPAALADVRQTLAELFAQHQRAVAEFTENLPEEAQDDVRFLLARLDFSAKGVQAAMSGLPSGALGAILGAM
ncbi:hypothetical protein PLESTB_001288900 [Pleodorina starrii]|uniref:Gamma-tubulin complex component n=1 Tax=Pleodorina starrii TaxID=330485 RepID=A0A9W6F6V7_9CHLO|nr:hypothetical protein PLESTM_000834000 [Pleodorina starrii]GLC57916.1 hypothetical protein PLESTB_001288900 [Pleodorina starrii]GLC67095.1 hypothetical protein PLESTF_000514600 [Pleodorina starrii]